MPTNCPHCSAPVKAGAKFCARCGASLAPPKATHCPNPECGASLEGTEAFCGTCGRRIEGALPSSPPHAANKDCTECIHFRVATPLSTLLRTPGKNAMEAITKISEDETQVRDAEAKQKIELIKVGRQEWGMRPVMSDHCTAHADQNIFEIHELKNRAGDCPDFRAKTPQPARDCFSCEWREPHGDPYVSLKGITDNDFFRSASDGIDSEVGLEVTSIYHAKGSHPKLPVIHDYCRYFSHTDGKAFVALPYPNRHNDCLAHRPKVETAVLTSASQRRSSGSGYAGASSGRPSASGETIAAIVAEVVAATRKAIQGDPQALSGAIIRHFESIDDELLLEHFENFVVLTFRRNANNPVFAAASHPVYNASSDRARQLGEDDAELARSIEGSPFVAHFIYLLLGDPGISPEVLSECCAQTVRERYWLDRLGLPARRQFLNEERVRIKHGMYPQEAVPHVERVTGDLERFQSKMETGAKTDAEADFKQACGYATPLSVPQFVQHCEEQSSMARVPNPFAAMPLDDEQQRVLTELMAGEYRLDAAVRFLEDRHAGLLETINNFWRVGDQGGVPFDLSPYDKLTPLLGVLDTAHCFVTTMLNRYSRRLRLIGHADYPHAPRTINNYALREVLTKVEPTLGKALFPEQHSLDTVQHLAVLEAMKAEGKGRRSPAATKGARSPATPFNFDAEVKRISSIRDGGKRATAQVAFSVIVLGFAKKRGVDGPPFGLEWDKLVEWLTERGWLGAK